MRKPEARLVPGSENLSSRPRSPDWRLVLLATIAAQGAGQLGAQPRLPPLRPQDLQELAEIRAQPDIQRARLLLRVWLQLPELCPVPEHMRYFENRDRADDGIARLAV